jgi:serine phosphatase RsbU (regulator of sigma subunit)/PAS domain-containing protein
VAEAPTEPPAPLRATERARIDLALRAGRLGTYVWDLDAARIEWDLPLHDLFDVGPGDYDGSEQMADERIHPDDRAALRDAVRDVVAGHQDALDHECRWLLADGAARWVHCYGTVTCENGRRLLVGVVQDVTARRTAQTEREAARRAERAAQAAADLSRRRLELLAEAAALLDAPPDIEATLQQVADLAVADLADWCAVDLESDDGRPRIVAVAHRDPAMVAMAREVQRRWPPPDDDPARRVVLTTLAPVHVPEVTNEMLVTAAQDAEHLAVLRGLDVTSAVSVPLQAGGRGFGTLLLVSVGGRRLGEDDVDLALELGRLAGSAVEKTRLLARQIDHARELALSEARYRTIVEAGSLGVFRADPDGAFLTDIAAWRDLTGGSTLGSGWLDHVHPGDRDAARETWQAALRAGVAYGDTYRVVPGSGAPHWIHARAVPLRAVPGEAGSPVVEWVGTVDDVTDVVLARRRGEAVRASAEALARALGVDEVVHALHHVAATALDAHTSAVALRGPDGDVVVDQHGYAGLPVTMTTTAADVAGSWPLLHEVLSTGQPLFLRSPAELREKAAGTAAGGRVRVAIDEGDRCWAVVPLRYGRRLLGVVRFGWTQSRSFGPAERDTLQAIAAQHAAALVRARLYDAEREISLTLQAALAPRVPSKVNGVEVGVHYQPAGAQAQVGGDWVDALTLRDGRVCLVVGDVMGSGIPAAATMGRLRTAFTALALHQDDPAELLRDLDMMLMDGDLLATVGLAVLDPAAGVVDLYSAGHLPTLVATPDGDTRLVFAAQVPPVGVGWSRDGSGPTPLRVQIAPGSVVALCTDGLVETRDDAIDERLEAWRRCVAGRLPLGDLATEAQSLVTAMDAAADDDVTLLLARLPVCEALAR